jgi:hypothetical protein
MLPIREIRSLPEIPMSDYRIVLPTKLKFIKKSNGKYHIQLVEDGTKRIEEIYEVQVRQNKI